MAVVLVQAGAFAVDGDILRASVFSWNENQVGINNICYRITGSTGVGIQYGDLAFNIQNAVEGPLQALLPLTGFLLGTKVANAKSKTGKLSGVATSTSIGSGSDCLPTQTSGIITFNPAVTGRGRKGRIFVPFPKSSKLDVDGTPTASYVIDLQNYANALAIGSTFPILGAGGGSAVAVPTVYQRATDTHSDIATFLARKEWATQRRRGNYGRPNPQAIPY